MLSGVVLAGGVGSRMGGDKGLVRIGARPMFMYAIESVSRIADDVLLAVAKDCGSKYAGIVDGHVRVVEDTAPGRGPLEGLINSFELAKGTFVAVIPCDAPFVRYEVLSLLASKTRGYDGAVPVVRGFIEPLVAVYARTPALQAFKEELAAGTGKVSNAVARLRIARVQEEDLRDVDPDLSSFWNINSQADLSKAEDMTALL